MAPARLSRTDLFKVSSWETFTIDAFLSPTEDRGKRTLPSAKARFKLLVIAATTTVWIALAWNELLWMTRTRRR